MIMPDLASDYALALALSLLALAAVSDVFTLRIPNEISLTLAGLWPVYALIAPVDVLGSLGLAGGAFVLGLVLFSRGLLGGGDVKLVTATLLWVGPAGGVTFLIIMALTGGAMALFYLSRLRFTVAAWCEAAGDTVASEAALHDRLPYGLAIAVGGYGVLMPLFLA